MARVESSSSSLTDLGIVNIYFVKSGMTSIKDIIVSTLGINVSFSFTVSYVIFVMSPFLCKNVNLDKNDVLLYKY